MKTISCSCEGAKTEFLGRQALQCGSREEALLRGLPVALNGIAFAPAHTRACLNRFALNGRVEAT
jgi:hypothetical protein